MRYLELDLYNMGPLRIGNDDTSQRGQTNTLAYIPGSTIRGLTIHRLCREESAFAGMKQLLFSDKIHFMNAYVKKAGKTLLPSLKGFYEEKAACEGKKEIENIVVAGKVSPGKKRASLGRYCYPEGDCIFYGDVELGEDMSINRGREGEKTVFRSQYIRPGQYFAGYITFDDCVGEDVIRKIQGVFSDVVYIGNNRHGGYGACRCVKAEVKDGVPYADLRTRADRDRVYMVLLSNMTMRDRYGQPVGLDLDILAEKLGCGSLESDGLRCATSVTEVMGYNRSWKGPVPSMVMYEAGSVFCLETKSKEPIPAEKLAALEEEGIGIRRNEGFGQILFLDSYERLAYKQSIEGCGGEKRGDRAEGQAVMPIRCELDPEDVRIAAKGLFTKRLERAMERYIVEEPLELGGISRSKLGVVQSLCQELQYIPVEARTCIEAYIRHSEEKDDRQKVHGGKERQSALHRYVRRMLDKDLLDILKIPERERQVLGKDISEIYPKEELEEMLLRCKLQLMIRQIRYANREVREHDDRS